MTFFSGIIAQADLLRGVLGRDADADDIAAAVSALADDDVATVIREAATLARAAENLCIVASGVAARRSTRESAHGGLAQRRGHGSAVSLVQELTGSTKADAVKQVRVGQSLLDASTPSSGQGAETKPAIPVATVPAAEPWHAPLGRALMAGKISSAQHDAIQRGLGEPPFIADGAVACVCGGTATPDGTDPGAPCAVCITAVRTATAEAWSVAAQQLVDEAAHRTVEELRRSARTVRDLLDPTGAEERFHARFQARSFRTWTDADGLHRGSIVFDDEAYAWVMAVTDSALRPRRGGPRFVDADEKSRAEQLVDDPRTNEQLTYDLIVDTLRAGALADAESVFGTRQAGVRVVTVVDAAQTEPAAGHFDDGSVVPAWLVAQHACDTATIDCTLDREGNPLYLGREARLFSPKQRLMLALRDGGCRWKGCDRPAHYCEAHHIDHYVEGGATDVDRGISLCRFHHMQLHHGGWRITRDGLGAFVLHPPPGRGDPIVLKPRLALRYAWAGIDPPPRRFRPAA